MAESVASGESDHTLVTQFVDLPIVHAEQIFEHIYRVFSKLGTQMLDLTWRFRQFGNHGGHNDRLPCLLFINGDEIPTGVKLTVAEDVGDIVQRPGRRSSGITALKHLLAVKDPHQSLTISLTSWQFSSRVFCSP